MFLKNDPQNHWVFCIKNAKKIVFQQPVSGSLTNYTIIAKSYTGTFTITSNTTIRASAENLDDSSIVQSDPVTIYVVYPLTSRTPGGGTVAISPSLSNSVVAITAIPDPGWMFISWSGDATGTNATNAITSDQPKSVQAIFGTSINLTTPSDGSIVTTPTSGPYPFGSTVQLTAAPTTGYYFVSWGGAVTGSVNPLNYTITNANPTVSALFAPAPTNQTINFGSLQDRTLGDPPFPLKILHGS